MKTKLLFIFIIITESLSAQIPVLNSSMIPNIGDNYTYQIDTIPEHLLNVTAGNGGENVTWDFSNSIAASGDTIVTSYVNPSTVNFNIAFPTSNIATISSDGTPNFYQLDNNGAENLGSVIDNYVFYFSNPLKLLFLPMTYLDNNTDSFAANYPQSPDYLVRTGVISAISDGYGTLIMPGNNTYQNVLRIKYTLNIIDSFNNGQNIDTLVEEYYDWYGSDITFPILQIGSRITNSSSSTENSTIKYIRIKTAQNLTTNISSEKANSLLASPNPTNGICYVNLPKSGENFQIIVHDMLGKAISKDIATPSSSFPLNLEQLENGIYFVNVSNSNFSKTIKLSKQ
jgi:hypothetical protein